MQLVDFAIVCALDVEFEAVSRSFGNGVPGQFAGHTCRFVRFSNNKSNKSYRLVIVNIGEMGNLASLNICSELIREVAPRHIILTGICGGLLQSVEDFRLGDVVVSDRVIYYEPAKIRGLKYESRAHIYESKSEHSRKLLPAALSIRDGTWTAADRIFIGRPGDSNARERPQLKEGSVCSGEKVIASDSLAEELSRQYPEAISIEMEAAGVAYSCRTPDTDFLMVKAVSDSAGEDKNDNYRHYACATAASFVHCLLTEASLPPLTPRRQLTVPLGDLLRLFPEGKTRIVMPSFPNPRHKMSKVLNYPYNQHESAFDDIYCALRISSALESFCGRGSVTYHFDKDKVSDTYEPLNRILLGSTVTNAHTEFYLQNLHFQFDKGNRNHDIISTTEDIRYSSSYSKPRNDGTKLLETDYALITAVRNVRDSIVVLAGCHAYGQLFLGDFLSNAQQTDELLQLVPEGDF